MTDPLANSIREKLEAGRRLSAAKGEYLFRADVDLHAVGQPGRRGLPPHERRRGLLQRQSPI